MAAKMSGPGNSGISEEPKTGFWAWVIKLIKAYKRHKRP